VPFKFSIFKRHASMKKGPGLTHECRSPV